MSSPHALPDMYKHIGVGIALSRSPTKVFSGPQSADEQQWIPTFFILCG